MTRATGTRDLKGIRLLQGLSGAALAEVASRCTWRMYEPGETLVTPQDTELSVVFLVHGQARVCLYTQSGQPISFRDVGTGSTVGELSAFDGSQRSAHVEATGPTWAARLTRERFTQLVRSEPTVAEAMLRQTIFLVRDLTERAHMLMEHKVDRRIHAELLRRALERQAQGNAVALSPAPTHAELASRVGTHREAVSRELSRLARLGLVERRRDGLWITDLAALRGLLDGSAGG